MGLNDKDRKDYNERLTQKLGLRRRTDYVIKPRWLQVVPDPTIFEDIHADELMLPMVKEAHAFFAVGAITREDYAHLYDKWMGQGEEEEEEVLHGNSKDYNDYD